MEYGATVHHGRVDYGTFTWAFTRNTKINVTCGNCGVEFKAKIPKDKKTAAQCPHCFSINTDLHCMAT